MAENKTKATKVSVADFIDKIKDQTRQADAKALIKLMRRATGEYPVMWGPAIVGFGSYHYKYESGREGDMLVVGFSPRNAANVLYGLLGSDAAKKLLGKLGKHTTGKGCLYVKKLADVDEAVLETLIIDAFAASRARKAS